MKDIDERYNKIVAPMKIKAIGRCFLNNLKEDRAKTRIKIPGGKKKAL